MSDLTVSDVLAEASTIYQEITKAHDIDDNIHHAVELAEEMGDAVSGYKQEGFNPVNTRLLKSGLESILGFNPLDNANVKLESGMNITQTNIVSESVKAVVRDFWEALKRSFNFVWSKLKSWYITITSASDSLIKKANKIKADSEKYSTSPSEKRFDFKDYKDIEYNGKVNSASLRQGLKVVEAILTQTLNVRTTNEVEKFITASEDALDSYVKSQTANAPDDSWVVRFSDLYHPSVGIATKPLTDDKIQQRIVYDANNAEYKITDQLPGNKAVVYSSLKDASQLAMAEKLGLISAVIVPTTERERTELSVNAETLHPAQIADICDTVIELNDQISFYEKAWERRDKFMSKVIANLDKSISRIDSEDIEGDQEKVYKKTTRAILTAIKRNNTFNASLLNYVVRVSAASLNYCSASLSLYKAA